jgi:class 3 adenylate cyclase
VIVQDDDLYGDGVNVAARLEALAEPGGICLSASAHEQVQTNRRVRFEILASNASRTSPGPSGRTASPRLDGSALQSVPLFRAGPRSRFCRWTT